MTNKTKQPASQLRIIAGQYRSRLISFEDTQQIRPTPNRVRETVFNWLQTRIVDAVCLDAFAGSGVLAFEALSRGAKSVLAIEENYQFAQMISHNAAKLTTNALQVIHNDFFEYVHKLEPRSFDIIFLDPPFKQELLLKALNMIYQTKILAPQGVIYFETEKEFELSFIPAAFSVVKNKIAGQVRYGLLQGL